MLQFLWLCYVLTGHHSNQTILRAIWNKHQQIFSKTNKIAQALMHQVQKKFIETLQVTLCIRSKKPHTIKTIIYKDIFTSLRCKKVQHLAKQVKELFSLVCYFCTLNFCNEFSRLLSLLFNKCLHQQIFLKTNKIAQALMHQVQKKFIETLQVTLCIRSKKPHTIKTIIYKDIFTSLRCKKVQHLAKQVKELFSLVCYFFTLNFYNELAENYSYLSQSELSNFFHVS